MIPQAQGVAYLHGTQEQPYFKEGGRYVKYNAKLHFFRLKNFD